MKPKLLYLSPVMPSPGGNGLAMRAFHNLAALSERYAVSLLVIPTGFRSGSSSPELRDLCDSISVLTVRPWSDVSLFLRMAWRRLLPARTPDRLGRPFELHSFSIRRLRAAVERTAGRRFDAIHVFRLYLAPYGLRLRRRCGAASVQLDLDDIESQVRRELGGLLRQEGRKAAGDRLLQEADAYALLERKWLPQFDRIFTCSELDSQNLRRMYGGLPVEVVPNVAGEPQPLSPKEQGGPFVLLFVGAFGYLPNADGLAWFCRSVLPLLRANPPRKFTVSVVGAGVSWRLRLRFLFHRRIRFLGRVSSIDRFYREAGAAVIPLRAGGGTRIKAIEAVCRGVPIVSTSKGVEGLGLEPGADVLIGDTPQELAGRCRELLADADLGRRLSEHALAALQKSDAHGTIHRILAAADSADTRTCSSTGGPPSVGILGLRVMSLRSRELNERILEIVDRGERAIIPNVNVHFAMLAMRQPWLRDFFNRAPINFCDGVGILIGARILGRRIPERITYADWIWSLAEVAASERLRLFFLGGVPGAASASADNLKRVYPAIQVVGAMHGYFDHRSDSPETLAVVERINRSRAQILVVGLGMPLQEEWLEENWDRLKVNIALPGGAVFDYISGRLRRPPAWMRHVGLEWLGRLLLEPRRLWSRYLIEIPMFLWYIVRSVLKRDADPP